MELSETLHLSRTNEPNMKCPACEMENALASDSVCWNCDYNLRPETALPQVESLRSSDVVAELEAELGLQWKALNTAAQARDRNAYHAAFTRIVDIESALATEPRRSATDGAERRLGETL